MKEISVLNLIDTILVHASSKKGWNKFRDSIGLESKIHVYPKTGNVVSASIPVAMANAIKSGDLKQ